MRDNSDTEVLFQSLIHFGVDKTIKMIDGMFAFALWANNQLILARDAMGIKPLFRSNLGNSLLFGSEVKALRAHDGYKSEMDFEAIKARIAWEYPLDASSLFKSNLPTAM